MQESVLLDSNAQKVIYLLFIYLYSNPSKRGLLALED